MTTNTQLNGVTTNGINTNGINTNGHAHSSYKLGNFSIDEARPIKVVAVGAGYGGIVAGIRLRQRVPNLNMTIYDSNCGVGGTWWSNRYPGLACDIPSHVYQLTFEENRNWSSFYAPGHEIREYLNNVVDKYKLRQYIKLRHRVMRAEYNESTGKWHLLIRRPREGLETEGALYWDWKNDYEEFEDTADILFTGLGSLSRWTWPEVEGLDSFNGQVMHSAQWETGNSEGSGGWEETVKGWGDKKVGVIGVGSSALQIVPALQPKVKHLTNYVRGQTWLSGTFVKKALTKLTNEENIGNYSYSDADKKKFSDPAFYKNFRWELESELNAANPISERGSTVQEWAKVAFREDMLKKLAKKPWIADHLIPNFAPCCRRLTPGPGYLEALCEDNVDFVSSRIKRVTPNGIETEDGNHQDLDVIVCATGFDTSFNFGFPIIGRGGVHLSTKFEPHPRTYLAIAVDGFPNWFQGLGPNSGVGAGSLLVILERQVDYVVAATLKMQRERLKSIEVKPEAVNDFDEYLESYFPTTVFSEKCRSWYKVGKEEGRIVALWPGSSLHATRALLHPRWEDYNYEPLDDTNNRFYWLGDGHTAADKDESSDKAYYLKEVDYPPVPAK